MTNQWTDEERDVFFKRFAHSTLFSSALRATEKLVAMTLANEVRDERLVAVCSREDIAKWTGLAKRTVGKCLAALREAGVLRVLGGDRYVLREAGDSRGRIYFARSLLGGDLVKIGYSRAVALRLRSLHAEALLVIPGNRQDEAEWHRRFASARRVGEWFEPTEALMAAIERAA